MKKLAIVCGSPASEMLAPFNDPDYEVWVLGNRCQNYPRFDLIFEIHDEVEEGHDPRYPQWLVDKNIPLIVGKSFAIEADHVTVFPFDESEELFGSLYLTSSPAMMVCLAILRGYPYMEIYGVDLVIEAVRQLLITTGYASKLWQLIILGTGDPKLEEAVGSLVENLPSRLRAVIRFDTALSHRIYAGADMLLIPSRYEPCGLTQMIAMRYGCVPIARSTGGLRDTIKDYGSSRNSTGFLFDEPSPEALSEAIGRAMRIYEDRESWVKIQQRGMGQDFSWIRSARQYLNLYLSLVEQLTLKSQGV